MKSIVGLEFGVRKGLEGRRESWEEWMLHLLCECHGWSADSFEEFHS